VPDWATIASLATAAGTLVLAVATFAAVRSANRSARISELTLQEQRRPVLVDSREQDIAQSVGFVDDRRLTVPGGGAGIEATGDVLYLAISLRNVGAGIAVLQGWWAAEGFVTAPTRSPIEDFLPLTRDQYIPSGDVGLWQAALREPADPLRMTLSRVASQRHPFTIDLLYTDQVGGQRTISRFGIRPGDDGGWLAAVARHWYLDGAAPR
jgi:hypothetical protein